MQYHISKKLTLDFDQATNLVKDALKKEGFGVLSEINISDIFKEKLNKDIHRYRILGACNPHFAYKAVMEEDKIGTMLPCNVIIQELDSDTVEISAVNSVASMLAIENKNIEKIASEIKEKLEAVISSL